MPTVKSYQKQKEKEKIAYNYFINQGYSPEASAGIVGNLVYESGLNTLAEGDIGYKGGSSLGIAQFRGKRLQDLKKRYGNKWTDFGNQLDFVRHELETTHAKAGNILKNTNDVYKAGQVFSDLYEVPAKKYNQNVDRQKKVNNTYASLAGGKAPEIVSKKPTPIADQAIKSYYSSIPTNDVKELDIVEETTNFTPEEDEEDEEDEETVEKDKDVEEVKQQTKEFNFLEEYKNIINNQTVEQPTQQEQQIQQAPQQNLEDIYNQVSEFVDTPLAQQGGIAQFYKEYINSPNYKRRLIAQGYNNPEQVKKERINNLNKITKSEVEGIGSQYYHPLNKVNIDNKELKKYNLNKETTTAHEYSHGIGAMNTGNNNFSKNLTLNSKETSLINATNKYLDIDTSHKNKKLTEAQKSDIRHNAIPSEAKADIDALRYRLKKSGIYDTGTQEFNQDILNKAKKMFHKDTMLNRNFKAFDDKDLIWLMNNIAQKEDEGSINNKVAQQGGQYYNLPQNTATPITPEQFTLDYLNSAKYKQRIENSGYDNPVEVISNRLNNIKTVNTVNQNGKPSVVEQMWMKVTGEPYSTVGSAYDLEKHTIIMDSADKTKKALKGTPLDVIKAHELGHAELRGTGLNIKDEDEIFNRQKEYKIDAFLSEKERDKIKTTGRKTDFSNIAHDLRPEENKSDLNGLRYLLKQNGIYDAGKEVFTKEHLKKLKPNFFKERLLKNYKEEDLIWLMNNIAKKEDEGSINSQVAQQGGVVKEDNLGQYKFPGEITQINSPNITMKNIPYNILGVADTGEQIMMQPNQNYYFKGAKTVTEYPQITENEKEFLKYISKLK